LAYRSQSAENTHRLGRRLGEAITAPLVVSLVGELGSGKTVFVQGLAQGLGVPGDYYVASPTYTLINDYPARLPLVHIDLYRLTSADDLDSIGFFDVIGQPVVSAVEWADRVQDWQPPEHLAVNFTVKGIQQRQIVCLAYGLEAIRLVKNIAQTR
jgi:tRNA threonylcarbamoyladenosine biosynthesis protein TsaE